MPNEAEWRAHHLINLAGLRRNDPVIAAAARAGWDPDGEGNIAALPYTPAAQKKLAAAGVRRPYHNSGHERWNLDVGSRLRAVKSDLDTEFGVADSPAKDLAARKTLEELQHELRIDMLKLDRVSVLGSVAGSGTA